MSKLCSSIARGRIVLNSRRFFSSGKYNEPISSAVLMRAGGIASFQRLPVQTTTEGLDACYVGVPMDTGATNRSGCRMGPRSMRTESVLVRKYNGATGANPFESMQVADIGDVNCNIFDIKAACDNITEAYVKIIKDGCIPLTLGGDHTITYPILRAIKEKYGKVGLIHVDAHLDTSGPFLGSRIHHGSPFRCAVEEDLLDVNRVIQIGIRGTRALEYEDDFSKCAGFRVVSAEECWYKSLAPLMGEVRTMMGDGPVYLSFDIDSLDPSYAPGTGTPEVGGLTSIQGLEIIRGCRGLNLVGCDLVEVAPQYDTTSRTALYGANYLFEMLCVLPGVKYKGDK